MRAVGYDVGVLFSAIPCVFYRKLGWASVPLAGFRVTRRGSVGLGETDWGVVAFDEDRDLEDCIALYDQHNAQQSGSLVRTQSYWGSGPARLREILPTVVARRENSLGGYLNFQVGEKSVNVLEVAYDRTQPEALTALVEPFASSVRTRGCGGTPRRHSTSTPDGQSTCGRDSRRYLLNWQLCHDVICYKSCLFVPKAFT